MDALSGAHLSKSVALGLQSVSAPGTWLRRRARVPGCGRRAALGVSAAPKERPAPFFFWVLDCPRLMGTWPYSQQVLFRSPARPTHPLCSRVRWVLGRPCGAGCSSALSPGAGAVGSTWAPETSASSPWFPRSRPGRSAAVSGAAARRGRSSVLGCRPSGAPAAGGSVAAAGLRRSAPGRSCRLLENEIASCFPPS